MNKATTLIPVQSFTTGRFNTFTHNTIDFNSVHIHDIEILDIAHSLSHICRFGGHCSQFYSVAQHSVLVAALAPDTLKKEALLHDAAEAYLGDVIKPLKHILGQQYADLEESFMRIIAKKFGLKWDFLKQIKPFDNQALVLEHQALIAGNYMPLSATMQKHDLLVAGNTYYTAPAAKEKFMQTFFQLF